MHIIEEAAGEGEEFAMHAEEEAAENLILDENGNIIEVDESPQVDDEVPSDKTSDDSSEEIDEETSDGSQ